MHINEGYLINVVPLNPSGTNSTFFTECCHVAICDCEGICPICKRKVIGYDAESNAEAHRIRWESAASHWKRKED